VGWNGKDAFEYHELGVVEYVVGIVSPFVAEGELEGREGVIMLQTATLIFPNPSQRKTKRPPFDGISFFLTGIRAKPRSGTLRVRFLLHSRPDSGIGKRLQR